MNLEQLIRGSVKTLPVYQPGKPIDLVARDLGLEVEGILKLASNENPLGCPPSAKQAAISALDESWLYPDNDSHHLKQGLIEKFGFAEEELILGAGSNEIFYLLCDAFIEKGDEVIVGEYAFISYLISALLSGAHVKKVSMPDFCHDLDLMRDAITEKTRLIFLPNPNNPTGTSLPVDEVEKFAQELPPHVIFCYDEAYFEYQEEQLDVLELARSGVKIIGTRTFSKIYGLAGLRIGYGYGNPSIIELLNRVRPPFNTSNVAQAAALAALRDKSWINDSLILNQSGLKQLADGLRELGFNPVGDCGNFVLVEVGPADHICTQLMKLGIIVRPVASYGLPRHLRISIGTEEQNARCLEALKNIKEKGGAALG